MEYLSRELPTHLHTTRHSSSQQQENLPREPPTHLHTTRHSSSPQQENLPRESTTLARRRRFWRTRFLATVCAVLDRHRRRARRRPWLLSSAKPPLWRTLAVPETHRRSRGASRAPEAWLWRELALLSLSRFCGTFCQPIHQVRRRSRRARFLASERAVLDRRRRRTHRCPRRGLRTQHFRRDVVHVRNIGKWSIRRGHLDRVLEVRR